MLRPVIDERHREKRRQYLKQFDLDDGPDEPRELLNAELEFGPQPITTSDLYDLYLYDFVKTLQPEMSQALKLKGGVMRNIAQAHAVAAAHSMMLMYLMVKGEGNGVG